MKLTLSCLAFVFGLFALVAVSVNADGYRAHPNYGRNYGGYDKKGYYPEESQKEYLDQEEKQFAYNYGKENVIKQDQNQNAIDDGDGGKGGKGSSGYY